MKTYGDLNLKAIREACGLDFAHYTYQKNQCSCCYGPQDQPKRYWLNGIIPEHDNYSFVLFKNAYNGSGTVTKSNIIEDYTCIEHKFNTTEQAHQFCKLLKEQLGNDYVVTYRNNEFTVVIHTQAGYLNDVGMYNNFKNTENTMLILK